MRAFEIGSGGAISLDALTQLGDALVVPTLLDERPTSERHRVGSKERDDLLRRERQSRFRHDACLRYFATQLMQRGSPTESDGQAEGVRNLLSNCDGPPAALQSLVWIAEKPEHAAEKRIAIRRAVEGVAGRCRNPPFGIVESDTLLPFLNRVWRGGLP